MNTGEHTISERTGVSLGLLITVVVLAATAGSAHWRIGAGEKRVEALDKKTEASLDKHHSSELRVQRLEDNYAHIVQSLGNIEKKLEKMAGTRHVRGER